MDVGLGLECINYKLNLPAYKEILDGLTLLADNILCRSGKSG
jgi:hypothetical protein